MHTHEEFAGNQPDEERSNAPERQSAAPSEPAAPQRLALPPFESKVHAILLRAAEDVIDAAVSLGVEKRCVDLKSRHRAANAMRLALTLAEDVIARAHKIEEGVW